MKPYPMPERPEPPSVKELVFRAVGGFCFGFLALGLLRLEILLCVKQGVITGYLARLFG